MVNLFHKTKGGAAAIQLKDTLSEEEQSLKNSKKNVESSKPKHHRNKKSLFLLRKKSNSKFNRLKDQGSSILEDAYEPPKDFFAKQTSNEPIPTTSTKEAAVGTDPAWDVAPVARVILTDNDDTQIKQAGQQQHDEFSQFVFDQTVNTLQTVTVADSESGSGTGADAQQVAQIMAGVSNLHKAASEEDDSENFDASATSNPFRALSSSLSKKKQPVKKKTKPKTIQPTVISPVLGNKTKAFNNSSHSQQNPKQKQLPPLATGKEKKQLGDHISSKSLRRRPPASITTSDDATITSNISTTNATVMSAAEQLPDDHPFARPSQVSVAEIDPFEPSNMGITVWSPTENPFPQNDDDDDESKQSKHDSVDAPVEASVSTEDSLIDSIRKASSKDKGNGENVAPVHKPDPSPRGMSSALQQPSNAAPPPPPPPLIAPPPRTHHHHNRARAAASNLQVGDYHITQHADEGLQPQPRSHRARGATGSSSIGDYKVASNVKDRRKSEDRQLLSSAKVGSAALDTSGKQKPSSKTVAENAILASMLFRVTHSGDENQDTPLIDPNDKENEDDDDDHPLEIPPSIRTDESADSSVSSVTEEANSFYQKNFQGWKKQAHSVLEHYHQARKTRPHKPESASTSLLEKVEEENMGMFKS